MIYSKILTVNDNFPLINGLSGEKQIQAQLKIQEEIALAKQNKTELNPIRKQN